MKISLSDRFYPRVKGFFDQYHKIVKKVTFDVIEDVTRTFKYAAILIIINSKKRFLTVKKVKKYDTNTQKIDELVGKFRIECEKRNGNKLHD